MSLQLLNSTFEELPWSIKDQIMTYAETVKGALPSIFKEAEVDFDNDKSDRIIFIAGLKKLYSIISCNDWILKSSTALLEKNDVGRIKFGGTDFSRDGEFYSELRSLNRALDKILQENQIKNLIELNYIALVKIEL